MNGAKRGRDKSSVSLRGKGKEKQRSRRKVDEEPEGTTFTRRERNGYALITDLFDIEQPTVGSNVRLSDVLDTIDDRRADSESNTVVISLPDTSNTRDFGLFEDMLSKVCTTASAKTSTNGKQTTHPKSSSP
jgi:hypothetical protein